MLREIALFSACIVSIPACVVSGAIAFAVLGPSERKIDRQAFSFTGPINPSSSEVSAFLQATRDGSQLPDGWSITAFEGQVKAIDTGIVLQPSGERAWSVTVVDETADLSTATIYLDDVEVYTATRANGGIVDRGNMGVATLPVLLPPQDQPFSVEVSWVANDGTVRGSSVSTR